MSSTKSQRAGRAEQVLPKNLPPEGVQQQDSWSETGPAKGLQKETREQKVQSDSTRETKQKVQSDSTRANSVVEESDMRQREQAKRLMILTEAQVQQQAQPQSGVCTVFQTEHRVLTKMPQIFVVMKDVQQEYHAIREAQEKVQIQFIAPKEVQPEHQDLKKVQLENEVVEIAKPKTQILNAPERKTPEPLGLVQPEEDLQHESDVWDKVKGDTTELNDWEQDTKLLMDLRQVTRILAQLEPQLGTKNETKLKTNNPKIPHQITAVTVELQPVNKALTQPQLASEVFQRQLKLAREAINKAHNNVRPPKRSQSKSRQLIKMNPETKGGHYSRETQFGIQQQDEQHHWTQPQCRTLEDAWSPRETRKGVHAETESGTRTQEDAWSPRETRKGMHAETETRGGTQDEVDMPTRETNEGIKPEPETQDKIQQDRKRQEGIQPVMKILKHLEAKHKRMTQRESTIETPETRCITAVRLEKLQLEGRVPSKQKTESNTLAGPRVPMDIQKDSHTLKRTRAECVALKEVKPKTESQRNSQRETGLLEELQPVSMILQELQKKYDKPNEPPPRTHKSNQLCQDTGGLIALQTENEIHKLNQGSMILTKPIPKYEAPTDPVPETATKESKRGRFEVSERKLQRGVHKEMLSEVRTENGPCKEVQTEPENQEKVVRKHDKHTCKHSHELPGRKTSVSSTPSPKNNFRTETDHQDGEVQTATHEEGVNALRASPSSSITLSFLPVLHAPRMIVPPSTAVQKEPTAEHEGSKVETRHESDKQIHTKLRDNTMMEKDILDAIAISILPSSSSRSSTAVTLERKTTPVTKDQMNKDLDGCGEVVLVPQKSSESQEQQKTYHQEKENNQNEIPFLSGFSASSSSFSCVSSVASDSLSQIQPRAEDYFKRTVYPQVKESLQQSEPTSESKHAKNAKEERHSRMTSSSPSCELFLSLSATANNVTQCQNSKLQSEVQEDTELQETAQTKTKLQQTTATEEDAQFYYISFASNSSSMSSLSPVPSVNDPFASKLDNHLQPESEMSQDVGKEHRQRELMNPETKPLKPNVSNEAAVICSTMVSSSSSSELQVESSVNVIDLTCRQPEKEPESKECRQGDVNHACSGADITTQSNVDAAEAKETQPKAEASPLKRMDAVQEVEDISCKEHGQADTQGDLSGADTATRSFVDAAEAKETQPKAKSHELKRADAEQEVQDTRQAPTRDALPADDTAIESNVDAAEATEAGPKAKTSRLKRMDAEQDIQVQDTNSKEYMQADSHSALLGGASETESMVDALEATEVQPETEAYGLKRTYAQQEVISSQEHRHADSHDALSGADTATMSMVDAAEKTEVEPNSRAHRLQRTNAKQEVEDTNSEEHRQADTNNALSGPHTATQLKVEASDATEEQFTAEAYRLERIRAKRAVEDTNSKEHRNTDTNHALSGVDTATQLMVRTSEETEVRPKIRGYRRKRTDAKPAGVDTTSTEPSQVEVHTFPKLTSSSSSSLSSTLSLNASPGSNTIVSWSSPLDVPSSPEAGNITDTKLEIDTGGEEFSQRETYASRLTSSASLSTISVRVSLSKSAALSSSCSLRGTPTAGPGKVEGANPESKTVSEEYCQRETLLPAGRLTSPGSLSSLPCTLFEKMSVTSNTIGPSCSSLPSPSFSSEEGSLTNAEVRKPSKARTSSKGGRYFTQKQHLCWFKSSPSLLQRSSGAKATVRPTSQQTSSISQTSKDKSLQRVPEPRKAPERTKALTKSQQLPHVQTNVNKTRHQRCCSQKRSTDEDLSKGKLLKGEPHDGTHRWKLCSHVALNEEKELQGRHAFHKGESSLEAKTRTAKEKRTRAAGPLKEHTKERPLAMQFQSCLLGLETEACRRELVTESGLHGAQTLIEQHQTSLRREETDQCEHVSTSDHSSLKGGETSAKQRSLLVQDSEQISGNESKRTYSDESVIPETEKVTGKKRTRHQIMCDKLQEMMKTQKRETKKSRTTAQDKFQHLKSQMEEDNSGKPVHFRSQTRCREIIKITIVKRPPSLCLHARNTSNDKPRSEVQQ